MDELNWGVVTPEFANIDKNIFKYVFNHKLSSSDEVDRTVRFIVGRLLFYDKHLPTNAKHVVKIDARGQNIGKDIVAYIIEKVKAMYNKPNLTTIDIIQ